VIYYLWRYSLGDHKLATKGPKRNNAKLGQKGSWRVTWPSS